MRSSPLVKLLLEADADPNAVARSGHTALHCAVKVRDWPTDSVAIVGALLAAGARVDATHPKCGAGSTTPLDWAIEDEQRRLYPLLLSAGATIDMETVEEHGSDPYLIRVHRAGGWRRYEQAHVMRLVPVFAKIFPRQRLPHELASHVMRCCFHAGFY